MRLSNKMFNVFSVKTSSLCRNQPHFSPFVIINCSEIRSFPPKSSSCDNKYNQKLNTHYSKSFPQLFRNLMWENSLYASPSQHLIQIYIVTICGCCGCSLNYTKVSKIHVGLTIFRFTLQTFQIKRRQRRILQRRVLMSLSHFRCVLEIGSSALNIIISQMRALSLH